jgi:hypothetical protein
VVVRDGRARRARDRGAPGTPRRLPPREPASLRDRVARAGARLVRLAAAVVGPSDPDLDVPRRAPDVHLAGAVRVRRVRLCRARPRPRRGRSRRSAGPARRRSSSATTRAMSTSRRARSSASGRTG